MARAKQTSSQSSQCEQGGMSPRVKRTITPTTATPSFHRSAKDRVAVPTMVIDDDELFRAGMTHLLSGGGFRVIFSGDRLEGLLAEKFRDSAAVVVLGLGSDPKAGLAQVSRLKQACKGLRMAVLSEKFHFEEMVAAIKSGASGYFIRGSTSAKVLLTSLELISLGRIVLPAEYADALEHGPPRGGATTAPADNDEMTEASTITTPRGISLDGNPGKLSNREQMILQQLTQGATNKHIARNLSIAEATVKVHLKSLLRKIHVNNRTQAAMWARDHSTQRDDSVPKYAEVLKPSLLRELPIKIDAVVEQAMSTTRSHALAQQR